MLRSMLGGSHFTRIPPRLRLRRKKANCAAMLRVLIFLVSLGSRAIRAMSRRRADLVNENLALWQQVTALKKGRPPASARGHRPSILGCASNLVARMGEPLIRRQRRHGRAVESGSIPTILDKDLADAIRCHRELLEHVVVLSDGHFIRLVRSYISYYHEDRCHLGLSKDTPNARAITPRPSPTARVVALRRVGGLHHRYEWREAG